MKTVLCTLAIGLFTLMLNGGAYAASDEYKAAKKQEEANYKMAKAECKKLKGDEAKSCKKKAKADHEAAEEKLEAVK
jgi:predicted lipoprotein